MPTTAQTGFLPDLDAIPAELFARTIAFYIASPANPQGSVASSGYLHRLIGLARRHGFVVFSDECYVEFTWKGPPRTILASGSDGVVAVHSLSKRSNLAGVRVGFYAGDAELVSYLKEVRKHVGMMVPGPAQAAGAVALADDAHVAVQRDRYRHRLQRLAVVLSKWSGIDVPLPAGGFYLWFDAGDGWEFTERLARVGGALVSPGDFYGAGGSQNVRAAVVQPDDRIELVATRLGVR